MTEIELKTVTKQIKKYAKKNENRHRYLHSKSVAKMCVLLAKKFGLDEQKAYLIGISHDICKQNSKEELIKLASFDGNEISKYEQNHTSILHGRAASIQLQKLFNIKDPDILEAVASHVCGKINMNDYSKILFIADKKERRRKSVTKKEINELMLLPLDKMFVKALQDSFYYIIKKNYEVFPESQKVLEFYLNKD